MPYMLGIYISTLHIVCLAINKLYAEAVVVQNRKSHSIMKTLSHTQYSSIASSSSSLFQHNPALQWQKQRCKVYRTYPALSRTIIRASLSYSVSNKASPAAVMPRETKLQQRRAANATPLTPINYLERAAVVYGDCPAILYNDTVRTWSEMYKRCLKLASSIASLGIKRGDVVSVVAPNIPAMSELHFAVPMAGAILNTINLRLDATPSPICSSTAAPSSSSPTVSPSPSSTRPSRSSLPISTARP